jgi:uncharacterized OsmC-like protein/pimeloyl-ACP methyl ester carboxylesterase
MATKSQRLSFPGGNGAELAARLDFPDGAIRAFVLFAHCFTCSKDFLAAKRIAAGLAARGFAVMRFDFTGLGASEGEFASTNFTSNVADLVRAVDYLREHFRAPSILIGHSLGGAAVLSAAPDIPEVRAVATIAAPAEAAHVAQNFLPQLDEIREKGEAEVTLAGRSFKIQRQFIEDLHGHMVIDCVRRLKKPLMILHSPLDQTVGIENAAEIFTAAKHPKSFVSLDTADHLLTDPDDAAYVADVIASWAVRYVHESKIERDAAGDDGGTVVVRETQQGKYQSVAAIGRHRLLADEPNEVGGLDSGPSPYEYLSIALGACTTMTLRIYAEHKKLDLGRITVRVDHGKVRVGHEQDSDADVVGKEARIDRFRRQISVDGETTPEIRSKLLEIAGKCPVHRTLLSRPEILTEFTETENLVNITEV